MSVSPVLVSLYYMDSRNRTLTILDAARPVNYATASEGKCAKLHAITVAVIVGRATAVEQGVHSLVKICPGHSADRNLVLAHPDLDGAVVEVIERGIVALSLMSCHVS